MRIKEFRSLYHYNIQVMEIQDQNDFYPSFFSIIPNHIRLLIRFSDIESTPFLTPGSQALFEKWGAIYITSKVLSYLFADPLSLQL